ncbi:MAG TPA: transcriptional regulator NrdR [Pseudogracilibacillus sp.]|nr:transcriptional regulator NrdR [Pseudogracilibacillus sp.]
MKCPKCYHNNSRVLDSRPFEDGDAIRRRRECERCGFRFRTFERKEETPLIIVKKDGTRQEFVREKLIRGLMRACEKRPVTIEEIEQVALEVEQEIRNSDQAEISSQQIGEMVLDRLAEIDEVAYVRFASVYRQFESINFFLDELKEILQSKRDKKEQKNNHK